MITVNKFEGWPLGVHGFGDSEARILDVELAKRLGFKRPRDIRGLIERLQKEGVLPSVYCSRTVRSQQFGPKTQKPRIAQREVREFWLTQAEALFVAARSETKGGAQVLWALIAVFRAAAEQWQRQQGAQQSALAILMLTEKACDWTLMWTQEFAREICRLHRMNWDSGRQPGFLASTYWRIYKAILTPDVYRELRARHGKPKYGDNHHLYLTPKAREALSRHVVTITALARTSQTKEEFWDRFDHEFAGGMLQLGFFGSRRTARKSRSAPRAEESR